MMKFTPRTSRANAEIGAADWASIPHDTINGVRVELQTSLNSPDADWSTIPHKATGYAGNVALTQAEQAEAAQRLAAHIATAPARDALASLQALDPVMPRIAEDIIGALPDPSKLPQIQLDRLKAKRAARATYLAAVKASL